MTAILRSAILITLKHWSATPAKIHECKTILRYKNTYKKILFVNLAIHLFFSDFFNYQNILEINVMIIIKYSKNNTNSFPKFELETPP